MRLPRILILFSAIIAILFISLSGASAKQEINARIAKSYGKLPLSFVENRGQIDKRARFVIRGPRASAFFRNDGVTFDLWEASKMKPLDKRSMLLRGGSKESPKPENRQHAVLKLTFKGADPKCQVKGMDTLPGKVNYMIGKDKSKWHTDVPTYKGVIYKNVWHGIDIIYRGDRRQLKYDIRVNPGADLKKVRLQYDGTQKIWLDKRGDLHIKTAVTEFIEKVPGIYQEKFGKKINVAGGYKLLDKHTVSFSVKDVDSSLPLVIDPASDLVYSTFLGGGGGEIAFGNIGTDIATDGRGCAYVCGYTGALEFPTTPGAYIETWDMTVYNWERIAFITKFNMSGNALEYSTFVDGCSYDGWQQLQIAADNQGCAYMAGYTRSGFMTTPGAYGETRIGPGDSFVFKLNSSGSKVIYSALLGGRDNDTIMDIVVDNRGAAYVCGGTISLDFPTTPGAFDRSLNRMDDIFVTKLNPSGSGLEYSTLVGGSERDTAESITIDDEGCAYVAGVTQSLDFPVTNGAYDISYNGGNYDGFVFKVNPLGTALQYSSYLGGSAENNIYDIAVDNQGNTYVTGETTSPDFPITPDAFDKIHDTHYEAFISKFNHIGSKLVYSTYLGGSGDSYALDIGTDDEGYAYVCGITSSTDFPTTPDAFDRTYNGNGDTFFTVMNGNGSAIEYSTFLGGSNYETDFPYGMVLDRAGFAYIFGTTFSTDFPVTQGAYDTFHDSSDLFITKLYVRSKPTNMYLTPNFGTISTDHIITLSCSYWDPAGYSNIKTCYLMMNKGVTTSGAGYFLYDAVKNKLYLRKPNESVLIGGYAPGSANVIDNGCIVLNCANTTVEGNGDVLTIDWSIVLKTYFAGSSCTAMMQVTNNTGQSDPWETMGEFTTLSCRPDMLIKSGTETSYSGAGIFNSDGTNQTKSLSVQVGQKVSYVFRAQNAGDANDSFRITGPAGGSGWSVRYYDLATNAEVTSQVTAAGWVSGIVTPGANKGVYVNVRPDASLPSGSRITLLVTAISESDNTKLDVVKAVTTCIAAYQSDLLIKNGSDTSYIGADIFNVDGTDQAKSQSASAGQKVVYSFRIKNAGYLSDSFMITGSAGGSGWIVRYYDLASVEITSQVTGSGWSSGTLASGTDRGFFVKVSRDGTVASGAIKTLLITATSVGSGAKKDVVKAVTTAL